MTTNEDQSRNGCTEGNASTSSSGGGKNGAKSSSPKASPSSWNNAQIHRGRSRTRGVGSNRDENNGLRRFASSHPFPCLGFTDIFQRIPCVTFFVWEGVQCRKAMEDHSGNGFRGLWFRRVRQPLAFCHTYVRPLNLTFFSICIFLRSSRSAADEITGEVVAIKLVTRVTERVQLSKRALREITLLRHFAHHENITGLIDVDASSQNLEEM